MARKLVAMAVAVLMLAGLLAGCVTATPAPSAASTPEPTKAPEQTAAPEPTPAPQADKKPVVLTRYVVAATQTQFNIDQEKRFLEQNPDIIMNDVMLTTESDGTDAMALFASGNNPDFWGTGLPQYSAFVNAGMAMPLDDYVATWADMPNIHENVLDLLRINGKLYGIPTGMYCMVLYYNKKLFAEAGLNPPKTWDELLDCAKKLTVPEKQQWGYNMLPCWEEWHFEFFVWMAGGDLTRMNDDGTLALTFNDPAVKTAMQFYQKLINEKVVEPDFTMDYNTWCKTFATGNAAMMLGGHDGIGLFQEWGMNPDDIGICEFPVGPSGKKVGQLGGNVSFIFSNVSKEKADAAFRWLTFVNSKAENEASLIDGASKGGATPVVGLRKDVDYSLGKINPEWQAIVDSIIPNARLEFFGKGVVGGYVANAVRKLEFEQSLDIEATFLEQQNAAKADADKFNERVLADKK